MARLATARAPYIRYASVTLVHLGVLSLSHSSIIARCSSPLYLVALPCVALMPSLHGFQCFFRVARGGGYLCRGPPCVPHRAAACSFSRRVPTSRMADGAHAAPGQAAIATAQNLGARDCAVPMRSGSDSSDVLSSVGLWRSHAHRIVMVYVRKRAIYRLQ